MQTASIITWSRTNSSHQKEETQVHIQTDTHTKGQDVISKEINHGKKEGKDQESIQSSTTSDPGYKWECNKLTIRHHKREPRVQPNPGRWSQGINKQTRTKA